MTTIINIKEDLMTQAAKSVAAIKTPSSRIQSIMREAAKTIAN
jgi:hypothetical protein